MREICSSERCWTLGFSAILGARSPPRPSRPWQWAQVEANLCLPGIEAGLVFFEEGCRGVCGQTAKQLAAQRAARSSTNFDQGLASIGETRPRTRTLRQFA